MLARISSWFYRVSQGYVALVGVIVFVLFGALVLPREAARAEQTSGGAGSPDTNLLYSAQDLYDLAEIYGPDGRSAYVRARFTFDVAFPLVYGFFLVTAISWLGARVLPEKSSWRLANLVPVLGVLFDFLENSFASILMIRYPAATPFAANLAPWLSLTKWGFVYGSFAILGSLLIMWGFRSLINGKGE